MNDHSNVAYTFFLLIRIIEMEFLGLIQPRCSEQKSNQVHTQAVKGLVIRVGMSDSGQFEHNPFS